MPAKKRCQANNCRNAAVRVVGDCNHCQSSFCGNHRLPETHDCGKLKECRQQAFELNRAKLESQTAIAPKLVS
ncbi:hypothetical protein M408DRAFT_329087 [Serendipita vermifera MAFF 305830]|uniref:AN1-type domain-containing protein n=1 Tax=Serendipita vermifera MAFF 305830 TaxID=933852 RepID=A0A0C3BCB2_SERVB|nr:hypothetical protein M408DRAFT_329087 [Serendipita vermifera MAFF 305830]